MKSIFVLSLLICSLNGPAFAESVNAIQSPELEENLQEQAISRDTPPSLPAATNRDEALPMMNAETAPERPAAPSLDTVIAEEPAAAATEPSAEAPAPTSPKLGRKHWYDALNVEGDVKLKKKRKKIIIIQEDEPEYVAAPRARKKTVGNKIDEALNRKIAALHEQINQKVVRALDNMKVDVSSR